MVLEESLGQRASEGQPPAVSLDSLGEDADTHADMQHRVWPRELRKTRKQPSKLRDEWRLVRIHLIDRCLLLTRRTSQLLGPLDERIVLSAVFLMRLLDRRLSRVALLLSLSQLGERVPDRIACANQLLMRR
jgi:hypothetical protein